MSSSRPMYAEVAPSSIRVDQPVAARVAGVIGWCLVVFGAVVALTTIYMSPRWIPDWLGWLAVIFGLVGVFVHAAAENDALLRQVLGWIGALCFNLGLAVAIAYYSKWPVSLILVVPGLILLALYARRENDPEALPMFELLGVRMKARYALGLIGAVFAVVGMVGMFIASSWIAGAGSVLAIVGLLTLITYLCLEGPQSETGRLAAIAMSILGAVAVLYALLRSTIPFLIHDWRSPVPAYALPMTVLGASSLILGVAGRFAFGSPESSANAGTRSTDAATVRSWSNIASMVGAVLLATGLLRFIATSVLRSTGWGEHVPAPYLVPNGLVQMFAGLLFVIASISFWSEHRLVVMTRREFSAFFASPVAYFVMF